MGRFTMDLLDRSYDVLKLPQGVEVFPERWSWDAIGGCKEASIKLVGPHIALMNVLEWCRYGVVIRSDRGIPLWWGYVEDASVEMGSYSLGMRIDRMYNRVSVAYTYLDEDGIEARGTTDWAEDSYNTSIFGQRELRYSQSDLSLADAEDLAAALVDRYKDPVPYLGEGSGSRDVAHLVCKGWWNVLNWRYFEYNIGLEEHTEGGSGTQVMGVGFTSTDLVIDRDGDASRVYNLGTAEGFRAGDKMVISGSGVGNNGTRNIVSVATKEQTLISATTISFAATDNIRDSASGFDDLNDGDWIYIEGSVSNNGMHHIQLVEDESSPLSGTDYDHIDTDPENITTEAAGASVQIRRQGYITIAENVNDEGPDVSLTIYVYGVAVAQRFTITDYVADWTALEIEVRIRKVGSPTDNVRVAIWSDLAGLPNVELDGVDMDAADISTDSEWVSFTLPTGVSMTSTGAWWIVVDRDGGVEVNNFYELAVDEDSGYAGGYMRLWSGTGWVARPTSADLYFRVWGREDNATQLTRMLTFGGRTAANLFSAVTVPEESGRISRSNRDGESTVDEEVNKLLKQGTSTSVRYLAEVTEKRTATIYPKPERDTLALRLRSDGTVIDANGALLELGSSIAGKWLALEDKDLPASVIAGFTVFVESAEYDASSNKWRPRSENIPDPYDFAALQQG